MANQPETSTYPDVYQLEPADPVQGGLGGVSNQPLLQLASRTRFLKDTLAALSSLVSTKAPNDSPDLTGTPRSVTPAADASGREIVTAAALRAAIGAVNRIPMAGVTTLLPAQTNAGILLITGNLTEDTFLLFPAAPGKWIVLNQTAGGFKVVVRLISGGAPVGITNNRAQTVWTDGGNFVAGHSDYDSIGLSGSPTTPTPPVGDSSLVIPNTSWTAGEIGRAVNGAVGNEATLRANADSALFARFAGYVEKGTGVGQLGNAVKLGWSGSGLKATVDSTDLGTLLTDRSLWTDNFGTTGVLRIGPLFIMAFVTPPVNLPGGGSTVSYNITFPNTFPTACLWMGGSDTGITSILWYSFNNITASGATGYVSSQTPATAARGKLIAIGH